MVGISYVTTVYNKTPFLPAVVAGLAAQRGDFEREYVFVDDGSSDGSVDELERLTAGLQNVTIHRQENAGQSAALNRGFAIAKMPIIKPLDGDDVLLPDASGQLLEALERYRATVAIGWDGRYDLDNPLDLESYVDPRGGGEPDVLDEPLAWVLRRARFNPSCMMVRAESLAEIGGCDPEIFVADYSLNLRLASLGRFVSLDQTVFLAPAEADGRVSGDGAQILHDINLALANFLDQTPALTVAQRRYACQRATQRAWKWAKRINGAPPFGVHHRRYLRSLLPLGGRESALCRDSCTAFRETRSVKLIPLDKTSA